MILIIGGLGYIGSNLVYELSKTNQEIIILDNLSNSEKTTYDKLLKYNSSLQFIKEDATDYIKLLNCLEWKSIKCIFNLASKKYVSESLTHSIDYYHNNLFSHINSLKICELYSIPYYIYSSSATVYGSPQYLPIDENHPIGINMTNPYGNTKAICEDIMKDFTTHSVTKCISLRYFNPIGCNETYEFGEIYHSHSENIVPVLLHSLQTQSTFYIYGNQYSTKDGTCIRDYIHITDLAIAHIRTYEYIQTMEDSYQVFNIGSENGYSVKEFIETFNQVNQIVVPYQYGNARIGDVSELYANTFKAKHLLQWNPVKTLKDMVRDSYVYFLKNHL
jgi:UDP-glucose 4-epimerase